jgi:single-strand DNA-binding protein
MAGLNKVILMGNLTKDPEYKTTPSGVGVATFSIAVGRRFAKQGDEVTADFFNVVAWRDKAEFVANYFGKGKPIAVVGSLQNRSWTDQNGQKRYVTEVIADECYFASGKGDGESVAPTANAASLPSAITGNRSVQGAINEMASKYEQLDTEEELPF